VIVSIIVAMDEVGGIGKAGQLPWHLSADLKNFKALTMGHHLIVGRKTYDSIGKALPGRTTVIVTRTLNFSAEGCLVTHTLGEALDLAEQGGENEVFIGGGGEIFAQALPRTQRIYLTRIHTRADCDVFFPRVDWREWREGVKTEHPADDRDEYPFTYSEFTRITI
jgi:dihydrofolate reductase